MTQSSENNSQQMARKEVENNYPNVYRADESLRNHAYAIAQQQVQNTSGPISENSFSTQDYAEAYIAAYRYAVEERDAQK